MHPRVPSFFFQAEDVIRERNVTGVQTCALPISKSMITGFDPDGDRLDPVIIDFGIAIAAEESRLTSTGLVMGTAAYLDPEVIRTDHAGEEIGRASCRERGKTEGARGS